MSYVLAQETMDDLESKASEATGPLANTLRLAVSIIRSFDGRIHALETETLPETCALVDSLRDEAAKMAAQIQELRDLPIGTFEPNENATLNGKPYKGEPLVMIPESKWKAALGE